MQSLFNSLYCVFKVFISVWSCFIYIFTCGMLEHKPCEEVLNCCLKNQKRILKFWYSKRIKEISDLIEVNSERERPSGSWIAYVSGSLSLFPAPYGREKSSNNNSNSEQGYSLNKYCVLPRLLLCFNTLVSCWIKRIQENKSCFSAFLNYANFA